MNAEEKSKRVFAPPLEKVEPRLCLVLARMITDRECDPGDVITYEWPDEPDVVRSLTKQELEDYHSAGAKQEIEPPPDPGTPDAFKQIARKELIISALSRLNHSDNNAWTESGQPTVLAVTSALMSMDVSDSETSRAEIRKFAPTFRRKDPMKPAETGEEV